MGTLMVHTSLNLYDCISSSSSKYIPNSIGDNTPPCFTTLDIGPIKSFRMTMLPFRTDTLIQIGFQNKFSVIRAHTFLYQYFKEINMVNSIKGLTCV